MSQELTLESTDAIHHGSQFKKILKHGSWYFVASILTKATGLLLLPAYTRYLSPEDYGIQSSLNTITLLMPIFISLYLDSAFGRYYFLEKTISVQRVKVLYSTHFWFICMWGSGVVLIALLISPYTLEPLLNIPFLPYIPLALVPALFGQLGILGSVFFRANLKAKEISVLNYVVFLSSTATILILLIPFNMGIQAKFYGAAVGALINFIYFFRISVKYSLLGFHFDWQMLKRSLAYSIPLIPNIAGGWISGLSDRLILAYYGAIAQVGLYSVSAQISHILYIVNDAMTQVQGPIAMSALTEDNEAGKKQISEFLSFFVWSILLFYLMLTFFSKEILYFVVDKRFHSAYKLVGILAFIYILSGGYRVFTTIISFHGKMWVISSAAIISALLNLILNFIFIPLFGQLAAAWTTLISVLAYALWVVFWAQKYDPIEINYRLCASSFLVALVLLAIQQLIDGYSLLGLWQAIGIKSILIFLYVGAIFVFPAMEEMRLIVLKSQKLLWNRLRYSKKSEVSGVRTP